MFYKLDGRLALRGWSDQPYALRELPSGQTMLISEDAFQALSFCNGNMDCDSVILPGRFKSIIRAFEKRGVVRICEKGEELAAEQVFRRYSCRFIRRAHWSITGKCNMRCRHCYMSAPQARFGELSHDKCMEIIEELAEAGVGIVTLTGGEPLVRGDFFELVDALLAKKIYIEKIYTNGLLVDDVLLDELDRRGIRPGFSLSFDGTAGWHDWMRGIEGAGGIAVKAIRLLVSRGYPVSVESAFHRDSIHTLADTMGLLSELGVRGWKVNPVSNSGNWLKEDRSLDLTMEELYDAYLDFIQEYFRAGAPISVMLGGFFMCEKGGAAYTVPCKKNASLDQPLCPSARSTMYIAADGKLLPCIPLSGLPIQEEMPSLFETTVSGALTDSLYLNRINTPVRDLLAHNPECAACDYKHVCCGGCRAGALMSNGDNDYLGADRASCAFFKGGYEEKIETAIKNLGIEIPLAQVV